MIQRFVRHKCLGWTEAKAIVSKASSCSQTGVDCRRRLRGCAQHRRGHRLASASRNCRFMRRAACRFSRQCGCGDCALALRSLLFRVYARPASDLAGCPREAGSARDNPTTLKGPRCSRGALPSSIGAIISIIVGNERVKQGCCVMAHGRYRLGGPAHRQFSRPCSEGRPQEPSL